jgi:hypothetical protein
MTARMTWVVAGLTLVLAMPAAAEPKPEKVDIKPFRDELVVLQDGEGGTYVLKPRTDKDGETLPARIWYGVPKAKELYEQQSQGHSRNGKSWSEQVWAPRIPGIRPGYFDFKDDQYSKACNDSRVPLTQLTGDKAKAILDKSTFMTPFMVRTAHRLARDDSGTYYYVDRFLKKFGGSGYRVFVGKKGAMKQLALTDMAIDTAGEVFSTKTGDLRLVVTHEHDAKPGAVWIKGNRKLDLVQLDIDANSPLIYSELGIWTFMGTLCDKM